MYLPPNRCHVDTSLRYESPRLVIIFLHFIGILLAYYCKANYSRSWRKVFHFTYIQILLPIWFYSIVVSILHSEILAFYFQPLRSGNISSAYCIESINIFSLRAFRNHRMCCFCILTETIEAHARVYTFEKQWTIASAHLSK